MHSTPGTGLSLASIAVGVAPYALAELGVDLPDAVAYGLLTAAALMLIAGIGLEVAARRIWQTADDTPPRAHSDRSGAGSVSGNVIANSTVNVGQPQQSPSPEGDPLRRAISDAETELDAIRSRALAAQREHGYPMNFHLPSNHFQRISDCLSDRDYPDIRRAVSDAYNAADALNHRVRGRDLVGGVFVREPTVPFSSGDDIGGLIALVDNAKRKLDELRSHLRASDSLADRLTRVRHRLKEGRDLQRAFAASDAVERPWLSDDPVLRWARATWTELEDDFPEYGYADEFYGPEMARLGAGYFSTAYGIECDDPSGRGWQSYLDRRVEILQRLLRENTRLAA